ncbi:MAG TPA: DUF4175 family protein, partial [Rhizomicrobium sp.]|nr:DUF4175 family protein [Rhizomicrobium sp.]
MSRNASPTGSEPRVTRRITLARSFVLWERLWRATFPASIVILLFCAATLFGLFAVVPGWLHTLILAFALFAGALALYQGFSHFTLPRWADGARRLERDNALDHRPVSESRDRLEAGGSDPFAEELWAAHLARTLGGFGALKLKAPRPGLWRADPYGLRFAAMALALGGLFVAGGDWSNRLASSLNPRLLFGTATPTLDAWIDPPAYTGDAPIYLARSGKTITVPEGSLAQLRVHNAGTRPRVSMEAADNARFDGKAGEYSASVKLVRSGALRVRADGVRLGQWQVRIVPDMSPVIAFAHKPEKTPQNALKLSFTAGDDYGVVAVRARITPVGRKAKPLEIDLALTDTSAKTLSQTVFRDLTDHPYAGMEVDIVLLARDAAGHEGASKPA